MHRFASYCLATGVLLVAMSGCGAATQAAVTNTTSVPGHSTHPELRFPKASDVSSVTVVSGPASLLYVSKNKQDQQQVISNLLKWLQSAKQTQVKAPKNLFRGTLHAHLGPPLLYLNLSNSKNPLLIRPAYFIVSKSKNQISTQYVKNVVAYGDKQHLVYLKSQELFQWIKQNQWKTDFELKH
ncbi:hypothetical protein [Alicyclobacillus sp. SO9]|uniref:hypothetical protein n=1 Tax=Alicyclobacillus sp. SO9 TaxID=2665646 RepID=UPI0018E8127B|nr:hypothetical protein [Alicyclobacillus sp. SO9]QQE78082.1 hypothetical protein GI364_19645 [Alicyclobacillus sp. SO9]